MTDCLVIFGESNNGKTYVARVLYNIFKIKTIYFDFIISVSCENIRNFFEKKEFNAKDIQWYAKIFDSENDFNNFNNDFEILLNNNVEFFRKLYDKSIKGTRSASSFKPGIDSPKDVINLAIIGKLGKKFGIPQLEGVNHDNKKKN